MKSYKDSLDFGNFEVLKLKIIPQKLEDALPRETLLNKLLEMFILNCWFSIKKNAISDCFENGIRESNKIH